MIEEALLNFGAMGLVACVMFFLLQQQEKRNQILQDKLMSVIENNTIAISKMAILVENCKKRGK